MFGYRKFPGLPNVLSWAEESFDTWLRHTHGGTYAEYYYKHAGDPDFRADRDPNNYPDYMTKNDGPLYGKGPRETKKNLLNWRNR